DAAHLEQVAEHGPLGFAQESVERHAVFLHRVMGEQDDFLAGGGQVVDGRHGCVDLVAHATHFNEQRRRLFADESAAQATDHRRRLHAVRGIPTRSILDRVCAWAIATASASAASAWSGPLMPRMIPIMCWTWVLSARPVPTTACFTSVAAYSCTTIPWLTTAHTAAPRAWPSLRAESALRAMNTRSIAASAGPCAPMMPQSSSKMRF